MRSRFTIAAPPGYTIKEQLDERGMSQKEFALRMDMSEKHISRLINGCVCLTPDVALRLECVLGVPSQFWMNLEARYRDKLARAIAENDMDADIILARQFPYGEMAKLGWVASTRQIVERVMQLRAFFQVAKLGAINNLIIPGIAYRRTDVKAASDYALAAWAQRARIEALNAQVSGINIAGLAEIIPQIRSMNVEQPEAFCPKLIALLAECGIALVFLPHMKGSFLHGASFYDGRKIVMGLTVRGRDADKFWFSLFHELAHILYGHIGKVNEPSEEYERAANEYSANTLVPPEALAAFLEKDRISEASIAEFAESINIAPGVVVGRLQNDGVIAFNQYNGLKSKYALAV